MTVEAKSGRVSRSRNCAMCFAPPIRSAAFFCSALYPSVLASFATATLLASDLR